MIKKVIFAGDFNLICDKNLESAESPSQKTVYPRSINET